MDLSVVLMIICPLLWCPTYTSAAVTNIESDLLAFLFKDYNPTVRPVEHWNRLLNVTFHIQLEQILDIDERAQTIISKYYVYMQWRNDLLMWDPQKWVNISRLQVKRNSVWIPDIILKNNAKIGKTSDSIQEETDDVYLFANGNHMWSPIIIYTSSLEMYIQYFPFDQQNFTLTFLSWSLDQSKLRMHKLNGFSMIEKYYMNSTEWEIVTTSARNYSSFYYGNYYMYITFSYVIRRKSLYYMVNTVLPCVITTLIGLFSYFLPPASGERMGVLITILLAFAVFLEVVASHLPHNSDTVSVLSIYFVMSMSEATFSFLSGCIVMTISHKGRNKGSSPPPMWIRRYILRTIPGKVDDTLFECNDFVGIENQETPFTLIKQHVGKISKKNPDNLKARSRKLGKRQKYVNAPLVKDILTCLKISVKTQDRALHSKSTMRKLEEEEERIKLEWINLANLLDRISFCIFILMFFISVIVLYVGYSQHN